MNKAVTTEQRQVQWQSIDDGHAGQRIDNYLIAQLKGVPKSLVYRILRKGEVRVNKKRCKPDYKLQVGDQVRIPPVKVQEKAPLPSSKLEQVQQLESAILYEDDAFMVINKPSGMAVHGGSGLQFGLIEGLRALRPNSKQLELVHRLDRDTSGLLLVAKKRSMLRVLHQQLRDKQVDKRYLALVRGQWQKTTRKVAAPLKKNTLQSGERIVRVDEQGKPSETAFRIYRRYAEATLVEASPITGRTHQIRVHTLHAGHPIAGDPKYGDQKFDQMMTERGLNRLFLHAWQLRFNHPKTGKAMQFEAPLDTVLETVLSRLTVM
ncbi:23S rRNA pseudouridine(955/2504/2580) synthase RluC [Idiomarina tyrosinivorans]|uniref:Pseudouridine synthase n=1 Tax=Idiomarina tyrosinivorans TaxID=1445662 RepID=A0A432ZUP1_9GAMM|nr:23S rRNA pseudouridine(955/2504/2580) synthase RluC [Idiomarina tyrosinivorans]RUO81562.1 23S rRNA pseudouridine(955/2504/2580) synthase RluC [Idiomarina tyrosinivorans]